MSDDLKYPYIRAKNESLLVVGGTEVTPSNQFNSSLDALCTETDQSKSLSSISSLLAVLVHPVSSITICMYIDSILNIVR